MPTYTYACRKCGHQFDMFHSITATLRVKCDQCKGPCDRLLGKGSGIIFKGSGFYETDYKNKKGAPPEKRTASKSDSPSEGSAASKPAAKPESKTPPAAKAAAKD